VFYWKKRRHRGLYQKTRLTKTPARPHLIKHIGTGFPHTTVRLLAPRQQSVPGSGAMSLYQFLSLHRCCSNVPSFWRDKRLNTHTHILETSWPTTGLSWCAWKTANLWCSVSVSLISWLPNFKEKARQRNRQAKYLKHEYFNNIAGNIHRCFVFINRLSCKRNAVRRRRAILMMSYIAEPVFAPGKGHSASVRMQSLL